MKKSLLTYILLGLSSIYLAQNEANIWYFGENSGLDFNSGTPTVLLDGELNTFEGCATISNPDGNLLFYTDGVTVWNRNHQIMPNGPLAGASLKLVAVMKKKKESINTVKDRFFIALK